MSTTDNSNYTSPSGSPFAMTTSKIKVADLSLSRRVMFLFNSGANPVRIYFSQTADDYIEIPSLQGLTLRDPAPVNEIYAASSTSTSTLHVIEG